MSEHWEVRISGFGIIFESSLFPLVSRNHVYVLKVKVQILCKRNAFYKIHRWEIQAEVDTPGEAWGATGL